MLLFSSLRWTRLLLLFWPFSFFIFLFFSKPVTSLRLRFPLYFPFLCTASNFAKRDVDTFLSLFLFPHSLFSHYLKKPLGESAYRLCQACVCVCVCVCVRARARACARAHTSVFGREREKWMMHVFCCHMHCFDHNKIAHCSWAHALIIE